MQKPYSDLENKNSPEVSDFHFDPLHGETNQDTVLWNNFRGGSIEAFDRIYYSYIRLLYNYGSKITGDHALVEDCIQDLFVELWQKKHNLSETNSIKYYLFKSLNRRIVRKLEVEKRLLSKNKLSDNYSFEVAFSHEVHLISNQISAEEKDNLAKALQSLTPRQKEAIFLKYYEKLSFEEVSVIMAINIKGTYKLVARAIDALRSHFHKTTSSIILGFIWLFLKIYG